MKDLELRNQEFVLEKGIKITPELKSRMMVNIKICRMNNIDDTVIVARCNAVIDKLNLC